MTQPSLANAEGRQLFDPDDPIDILSEHFRRSVCDLAIDAHSITVFREMSVEDQFVTFLAGVLTGLVGVCFASVDNDGRDGVMKALNDYLPMARKQASAIIDSPSPTNPTAGAS